MKISIVTISFNQCEFLKQCIESVLKQNKALRDAGNELEYIVVDPGSTDGSRELIDSYGSKIVKVYERDTGPADGLNNGFSIATGDIFAYINADDYFLDGSFKRALQVFSKNKCDVFTGHGWVVDENDQKLHRCLSHKFSLRQYALGNCVVMQQSTFFKRSTYENAGGFNTENRISWDGELMVDMALNASKIIRVNDFLSCFRVYSTSISGSGDFLKAAETEHRRIALKIDPNLSMSKINSNINWFISKLLDPKYIFLRILDGLYYGKRKIPS